MLLKQKVVGRSRAYDLLHKGWVNTCIVGTLLAVGTLFYISFAPSMKRNKANEFIKREENIDIATTLNEKEGKSL